MYSLTTLVNFSSANGTSPYGIATDGTGNLYTAMNQGGTNNAGTVVELTETTHVVMTLGTFGGTGNGVNPDSGVISDANGNLYGTTVHGGALGFGAVFEVAAGTQTITTLASFNNTNGANPIGALIADSSGNLYGTTSGGANGNSNGTVFEVGAKTHGITTLASFNNTNGNSPLSSLLVDANGNLYGTTSRGGANNDGTVFKVAAGTHALSLLASFSGTNGGGSLIADSSGNLYGTLEEGGANGDGSIFELNPTTGVFTTLFSFNGLDGYKPDGSLIADANGNLYGMTFGGGGDSGLAGTVFELNVTNNSLTTLFAFNSTDGRVPEGNLIADANGNLYGVTNQGGANNDGTLFELSPVPEPSSLVMSLAALSGAAVVIWTKKRHR